MNQYLVFELASFYKLGDGNNVNCADRSEGREDVHNAYCILSTVFNERIVLTDMLVAQICCHEIIVQRGICSNTRNS